MSLSSAYYDWRPGMPIREIALRWIRLGQRASDELVAYPASALWPYREYTWSRSTARDGGEAWDALARKIAREGWSRRAPLVLSLGKNHASKVAEGNHRLAIMRALAPNAAIPVRLVFAERVYKTTGTDVSVVPPRRKPATPPRSSRSAAPSPRRERSLTADEEATLDEIMKLL